LKIHKENITRKAAKTLKRDKVEMNLFHKVIIKGSSNFMKKVHVYFLLIFVLGLFFSACQSSRQPDASANSANQEPQNTKTNKSEAGQAETNKPSTNSQKEATADLKDKAKNSPETDPANKIENRCGWFSNPTPANAWLNDKDGEWLIGVQGGYQAEGDWPDFSDDKWVKTNVNYGYGCACLRVKVDYKNKKILEIVSAIAKPLADCRKDKALKDPSD
jgi:hypothetical protein